MTTDKLIDKLSKLKAMADGAEAIGNEAEASAFAEMFQRLLVKHKLDMTDIEFTTMEKEEPVERHFIDYSQYPDVRLRRRRIEWVEDLAMVIADAHFCRILVSDGSSRITLVGRRSDTAVAEYMLITLQRFVERMATREADAYKRKCKLEGDRSKGNGFRSAWINAFIRRLMQRYREVNAEVHRSNPSESGQTTALVRVNKAQRDVEDFIKENVKKSAAELSTRVRFHREGAARGRAAADAVKLRADGIEARPAPKSIKEAK